jgi:hypothetical protein
MYEWHDRFILLASVRNKSWAVVVIVIRTTLVYEENIRREIFHSKIRNTTIQNKHNIIIILSTPTSHLPLFLATPTSQSSLSGLDVVVVVIAHHHHRLQYSITTIITTFSTTSTKYYFFCYSIVVVDRHICHQTTSHNYYCKVLEVQYSCIQSSCRLIMSHRRTSR